MTRYRRHSAKHAAYARFRGIDDRASPKAGERRVCVPIAVVDTVERAPGDRSGVAMPVTRAVARCSTPPSSPPCSGSSSRSWVGCSATGRRRAGCAPSSAVSTAAPGVAWRSGLNTRRVRPVAGQVSDPRPRGRRRARGRVAPAPAAALLRQHRSRHHRGPARHIDAGAAATAPCTDRRRTNRGARTRTCAWHGDDTGAARHRRRPGPRAGLADRGAAHRVVRGDPVDGTGIDVVVVPCRGHPVGAVLPGSRHTDVAPMSPPVPDSGTPSPRARYRCRKASGVSPTDSVLHPPVLPAQRAGGSRRDYHCTHGRGCQLFGATEFWLIYLRPAESRPSKAISKAFSAGFQRIDQRRCPAPVGSRLMIAM
jgi:hypothetical protein